MGRVRGQERSRGRLLAGGAALAAVFAVQVSAASAQATSCTSTITGTSIPGDVLVPAGQTCRLVNDKIGGSVTVNGTLNVGKAPTNPVPANPLDSTTIGGNLTGNPGSFVNFDTNGVTISGDVTFSGGSHDLSCERILGNLTVQNENALSGFIGSFPAQPCASVGGNVLIRNNNSSQLIGSVRVNGDLTVRGNTGAVRVRSVHAAGNGNIINNTGGVTLESNSFGGDLNCSGNIPAPTGSGNTANGSLNGQCANLG